MKRSTRWKELERATAKALGGRRVLTPWQLFEERPDVVVEDAGLVVDCKAHHALLDDVQRRYCKPGQTAALVTKAAGQRAPKHTAAIFSGAQLLITNGEETQVYGEQPRCPVAEHAANPTAPRSVMKHADRPHLRFITAAMDTTNESATTEPARNGASVNRGTSAHE